MASGRVDASVVVENVGAGRMSARILHHPHCRRWIDQAIVARRKFPAAVAPCALTPLESHVLSLSERLPALLLALGLLRLAQPEYWVLKSYLKVVQPYLDAVSCAQLNMF